MARSGQMRSLKTIVQVRAAQEAVVQMRVAEVAVQREEIKTRSAQREAQLEQETGLWLSALSRAPADLQLANGWSVALLESRTELVKLGDRARANAAEANKTQDELLAAQARSDLARNLARRAAKRARNLAEEARLTDVADRFARSGRRA